MGEDGCSGMQLRIRDRKYDKDQHRCQLWVETIHDKTGQTDRNSRGESGGVDIQATSRMVTTGHTFTLDRPKQTCKPETTIKTDVQRYCETSKSPQRHLQKCKKSNS